MILCRHMKKTRIFLLLLSSVMISSCTLVQHNSSGGSSNNNETNTEGQTSDNSIQKGTILAPDYSYQVRKKKEDITIDDLFNLHNKVEILINVDKEELDKIQEDNNRGHKPEIYHLAKEVTIKLTNNSQTFTWEFENVGIRQKGNLSREPVFDGNKVNTQNHIVRRRGNRFTGSGRQNVVRSEHQGASFHLRFQRERYVHSHLVTVEVSVESGTGKRM